MFVLDALEQVGRFAHFALRALAAALLAWRRPGELFRQLYAILLGALPLGLVAGVALGAVVWIHLHGAVGQEYVHKVPEYLAMAVVLEFAPLGAGLIVAGRSGASLGAELGSMRLTEQIDALEVLGQSPWARLIGPRVLAAMLALPLLTVFMAFTALASSAAAELLGGTLSYTQYENDVLHGLLNIKLKAVLATLKTVVFGYLVAAVGCYCGMEAHGGTEGVGRAATRGVVYAIVLVLLADVVLVKLIQLVT
jgi:phospholipid/cholesterol/gamma-HCH transport system permease protein